MLCVMTPDEDDPLDALIDSVYTAVNMPALWLDVARRIGDRLGGTAYLFELNAAGKHTGRYCPQEQAQRPLQILSALQTSANRSMLAFLLGEAELQSLYCKQALTSHINDQYESLPDDDLTRTHGLLSPVFESDGGRVIFMLLYPPDGPGLSPENYPFSRRLARALGQGLKVVQEQRLQAQSLLRDRMLMRHDGGAAILIDGARRVVATTPAGTTALAATDLFDTRSGRLQIVPKDVDDILDELLTEIRRSAPPLPEPPMLPVIRDSLHSRADGSLCRFILRNVWPTQDIQQSPSAGHVLITLREAPQICREARDALQSLFGLSKSEARLAYYLAITGSLAETLETLGITRNTGKTHLRRIYEKTGTTSQIELFQLIVRISALY